ncbi:MAG: hypothetical protein ACRDRU_16345 [Pseudonocardiaceae bacterium]
MDDPDAGQLCRWDGNVEANTIQGVPKPEVIRRADWHDPGWQGGGIRLRGEVMTYVSDKPVSNDGDLYANPGLPGTWWTALRQALTALQRHPVPEQDVGWLPEYTAEGVERFFDAKLPMELFTTQARGPPLTGTSTGSTSPAPNCGYLTGNAGAAPPHGTTPQRSIAAAYSIHPQRNGSMISSLNWTVTPEPSLNSPPSAGTCG